MSTYINSPNGTGTDPQIATFSMWFKITKPEANEVYLFSGGDGGTNNSWLRVQGSTGRLYFRNRTDTSNDCVIQTNANYKDVNGWYHVVLKLNSTLSTAADRATMYVNGQEITSFYASTDMTQNNLFHMFGSTTTHIGKRVNDGSTGNVGGFLASHVHFCDGYAYDASYFGSTDATTGEWKINTNPSVTYGTRGFFILKDGNSLTDQSPNTNNFTLGGGTLTKTEDNPSNVFATFNPLISQTGGVAGRNSTIDAQMFNGNTTIATSIAYWTPQLGNMEMFSGKYYWEQKFEVDGTPSNYLSYIGIEATDTAGTNLDSPSGRNTDAIAYGSGGDVNKSNGNVATYNTWTAGDIVMCAVDLDNNYIYFGKNGTWQNSGDPTSGSSGTGGIAVTTGKSYITAGTIHRGGNYSINTTYSYAKCNFGNGYFGATAVSSAGTNASGNGIFEYDVPTGYTALSTKGLNL